MLLTPAKPTLMGEAWTAVVLPVRCLVPQLCLTLCDLMDCSLSGSSVPGDSPVKKTGVGFHFLLQGIFPTQGSNPGLLHCRRVLYQPSYHCSQRMPQYQGDSDQKVLVSATLFRSTPLLCQTRISILSTDFQSGGPYV